MSGFPKTSAPSSWIGRSLDELDTPTLLLDRRACQANLQKMAAFFQNRPTQLRPHFKNHKSVTLARHQLEAGACVGMTCAKLSEAEVLGAAGFEDLLIANQVVGAPKIERLVRLAEKTDVKVAVDDLETTRAMAEAAAAAGVTIGVVVEVDIGMGRCGVAPGETTLRLVEAIAELPGIRFDGIQAFEGHLVYTNDRRERSERARQDMRLAVETRSLLERHGIPVRILTGGSSATYDATGTLEGVDEIQAGSYATMDWRYAELVPEFAIALSVLARVISRRGDRAVLDVGLKGAGCEFGPPRILEAPHAKIPHFLSEEHCVVENAPGWRIGQVVRLLPSHACTTCNLYRHFVVHEEDEVVDVWPIEASGKLT